MLVQRQTVGFGLSLLAILTIFGAATASISNAQSTNGWRAFGHEEIRFSKKVPGGRTFTLGFRNAEKVDAPHVKGVIVSVYRPNRVHERRLVPLSDVPEFSVQPRFFDDIIDVIEDIKDFFNLDKIMDVIDSIKGLGNAVKDAIKAVVSAFKEFSALISEALGNDTKAKAVARYARAVRYANNHFSNATVAKRMSGRDEKGYQHT